MQSTSKPVTANCWRDLYVAALFEADDNKLAERIAEAEWALVLRARELFYTTGDHIEEESDLNDAMYALNALRNTHRGTNSAAKYISKAA